MTETADSEKSSNRRWYYALFFVLGALVGLGLMSLIVVPQMNSLVKAGDARYVLLKHDFDSVIDLNGKLQDALKRDNETLGKLIQRVRNDDAATKELTDSMRETNATLQMMQTIQVLQQQRPQ